MPFYASPEQLMRDKSEYARKNIARGRDVVVLSYAEGVLFVAENVSRALHKVAEIYDRIGFAAVGRYNEFENLRKAGVRYADVQGYSYNRSDVTALGLANVYAQALGTLFTEQPKPFEVEVCVAQVGESPETDALYRLTYDGSVSDEPGYVAMGGQAEAISAAVKQRHRSDLTLAEALRLAVDALAGAGAEKRELTASQLEVAVLDRRRSGRTFRRITGAALSDLLASSAPEPAEEEPPAAEAAPPEQPTDTDEKPAGKQPGTRKSAAPKATEPTDDTEPES